MRQKLIQTVVTDMLSYLNNAQVEKLQEVLLHTLWDYDISPSDGKTKEQEQDLLALFLAAKRIEGCSEKSLNYYQATTQAMLDGIGKPIKEIVTEDIRQYLTNYQRERHSSRVTIDNIRRILSSFFSWLEDEDYILKSPVRRIHKVKTASNIKETYSDETLELMRDSCSEMRDLAMIDLLASTGMRVGEMVLLNRDDVDFAERECVVFGKGDKERKYKGQMTADCSLNVWQQALGQCNNLYKRHSNRQQALEHSLKCHLRKPFALVRLYTNGQTENGIQTQLVPERKPHRCHLRYNYFHLGTVPL